MKPRRWPIQYNRPLSLDERRIAAVMGPGDGSWKSAGVGEVVSGLESGLSDECAVCCAEERRTEDAAASVERTWFGIGVGFVDGDG